MSILKKFLASNLTKYEEEQKRRYKKYLKIQKTSAKEIPKTEAELYEDYIERQKSLRQSRRKPKAPPPQEIIFTEPNSGLSLGPAPALLETTNTFVVVEKVPEENLQNLNISNNLQDDHRKTDNPPVPVRRKSKKSSSDRNSYEAVHINPEQNIYEEIVPMHDIKEKHQSVEINRISFSTSDSDAFFDCLSEQSEVFDDAKRSTIESISSETTSPAGTINSRDINRIGGKVNLMLLNERINAARRNNQKEKDDLWNAEDPILNAENQRWVEKDEVWDRKDQIQDPKEKLWNTKEEWGLKDDMWHTKDQIQDDKNKVWYANAQVWDAKDQIQDDKNKVWYANAQMWDTKDQMWDTKDQMWDTKDQIWETTNQINDSKGETWNTKEKLWDTKDEIWDTKNQIQDSKNETWNPDQMWDQVKDNMKNTNSNDQVCGTKDERYNTEDIVYKTWCTEDKIWKPQSITIKEFTPETSIHIKDAVQLQSNHIEESDHEDVFISSESDDETLIESFNDYAIIDSKETHSDHSGHSLHVVKERIKFDDYENLIHFSDCNEDEGTILDNNVNRKSLVSSTSSEDDIFEKKPDRKVNFDLANSFCTTYERARQTSSTDDSLTSTTTEEEEQAHDYSQINNQTYDEALYNQRDQVYKNFGVGLDVKEKKHLEPIYENSKSMDLVLLNCQNGYREAENTDEELDQFSEDESFDFDMNREKRFQEYYENIGDFKGASGNTPTKDLKDIRTDEYKENRCSLSQIENDLMEIRNLDNVRTQIDKIPVVLEKIQIQIKQLNSKEDEKYTSVLKIVLTTMKILGNLNCNFEEDLLKFQKDSMENISKCITTLKEL